jgi:hypothetical protein
MTEIESYHNSTGVRWEPGQIEDDFDAGNNSAKLFERSRIKALAGNKYSSINFNMFMMDFKIFSTFVSML